MTQQETITTDEPTEDVTHVTPLGERILLEWKQIYSFRSPAGHRYAVHIDGPTIANIHLATSEAVITYNQTTKTTEYLNPARLEAF